ncbi:MAG TPA: proteasome accessory factor PafA2 family protein [Nitrospiria bacterium]|nr:proteasome accessory factor PafA2 family protein [Nitrospiria bacterium]
MNARILGLETEYGCLIHKDNSKESPEGISWRLKEMILKKQKLGVVDLHFRAHDEPAGNGGFLLNGGRVYLDMGHLEYASPECLGLADLVAYDRAGDLLLQTAVEEAGLSGAVSIIKNNIDHLTGATFGSHENYLVPRDFPFTYEGLSLLIPFLVTRQLFTGAGRVGAHHVPDGWVLLESKTFPNVDFQLSQRSDHIVNDFYQWVQFNRAIINTRDEPLADPSRFRRIHLLLGDSNMMEYATALKMGTTSAVLSLIEENAVPSGLNLADPVNDLRAISRDLSLKKEILLDNGKKMNALEIQNLYLEAAEKRLAGRNDDTDWTLKAWRETLEALVQAPERLIGKIDWISKKWLLEMFLESEHKSWQDPWAASLDLEYHNLNPAQGLSFALEEEGKAFRMTSDAAIRLSVTSPPRNTRASARGELARIVLEKQASKYLFNWTEVQIEGMPPFELEDPYKTYTGPLQAYLANAGW